jgi:hypothetical protein
LRIVKGRREMRFCEGRRGWEGFLRETIKKGRSVRIDIDDKEKWIQNKDLEKAFGGIAGVLSIMGCFFTTL